MKRVRLMAPNKGAEIEVYLYEIDYLRSVGWTVVKSGKPAKAKEVTNG